MSAVTLESLRADFYSAVARQPFPLHPQEPWRGDTLGAEAALALEVWNVAELHDLPAAMLFKLSDETVDPREVR